MPSKRAANLCAAVTGELGRRIVAGEIAPGDPVPTQAELCVRLGVSRTTVREALMRLHGKGLVEARRRDGVRVLPTMRWNQFDADILAWRATDGVDADLLDQLYEVRACFEPRACALAAEHACDADRAAISAHFAAMISADAETTRRIAADLSFHLAIFAATRNMFFVSLGAAIKTALEISFRLTQYSTGMSETELRLHGEVRDAILAGRSKAAERSMRALLTASRTAARQAAERLGKQRDDRTLAPRARGAVGDDRSAHEHLVLRRQTDG